MSPEKPESEIVPETEKTDILNVAKSLGTAALPEEVKLTYAYIERDSEQLLIEGFGVSSVDVPITID